MKKQLVLAIPLIVALCSPLAAQEGHRGGFGNDRSDNGGGGGGGRDNSNSDDNKPVSDKPVVDKGARPARSMGNLGGGTPSNKGRNLNSPNRGYGGNPRSGGSNLNSNPGVQRSHGTIHHFNNGNSRVQPNQGRNTFRSTNNEGRQGQPTDRNTFRSQNDQGQGRGLNRSPRNPNKSVGASDHSQGWGPSHHELSPKMRQIGIKRMPERFPQHNQILRADAAHSRFTPPSQGPRGQVMKAKLLAPQTSGNATVIRNHMKTFGMNASFNAQVNLYNNQETVANHYYWHNWNGTSYCHYYDNWGYHWYGWYWGGSCFWSRWYGGYWWWYDPSYSRWCYWNDGNWWWNDPYHVDVVYVYNNGDYVSSTSTATDVEAPAPSQGTEVDFRSRDGDRTVKVFGEDAFLYDTSENGSDNKPVYLASNVKEVKFSKPGYGKPMQIMLILDDGSFEMFDSDGNPYNDPQDQP